MTSPIQLTEKEIKRFWSNVDIRSENECWNWKRNTSKGYGRLGIQGKDFSAHRIAWQIANGRTPRAGYEIAHAPIVCHNRRCCNPKHLLEKTHVDNELDKRLDGTYQVGELAGHSKLTNEIVLAIR